MTLASTSRSNARFRRLAPVLLALCAAGAPAAAHAQSRARERIVDPVDHSRFSIVPGNLHPAARPESDLGALDPATSLSGVTMFFSRTAEQVAALENLLGELQDPSSANYHRWLSAEEFADRFGLSQIDVDKIVAWLRSQGLTVNSVSRSRSWVTFSGTAQQVEAALRTDLRRYAVGGEAHFATSREPSVPSAFAGMVLGFRGLNDFQLRPHAVKKIDPRFTSGQTGNHFLAPGDLATIYSLTPLYNAGIDGTGQTLAVAGRTAINVTDVDTFRSLSGLPVNRPQVILVPQSYSGDADPGMVAGDIDEAYLDLDWAGAVARNATIKYVYSKNVLVAAQYIIDQQLAPVLSISYGLCEGGSSGFTQSDAATLASIMQQGNAHGITIIAPSGDNGAADCDRNSPATQGLAVDLPGALPYVTSVGGTTFSADTSDPPVTSGYWTPRIPGTDVVSSALSYIPESSWNDTGQPNVVGPSASGGGSSIYFAKPSWQTGTGVPADGARDVPDVSFNASANHDGYLVCSRDVPTNSPTCVNGFRQANGNLTVLGGTSAGVPIFAGIVTLINQQTSATGQGNVNPHLYAMAAASPSSFYDVTGGNNAVPFQPANLPACTPASVSLGYNAGTGYDLVTGLGSINASNLVTNWTSVNAAAPGANITADFQLSLSPAALTVKRGACGTSQVILTPTSGFVGTPSFKCSFAGAGLLVPERIPNPWWPLAVLLAAIIFFFGGVRMLRKSTQETIATVPRSWAPGFVLASLLVLTAGCKGGGGTTSRTDATTALPVTTSCSVSPVSTTPSRYTLTVDAPASSGVGTGTVTVTGTIGGVTRTTPLTVTVN